MSRAVSGSSSTSLRVTMRRIDCCHPSGVFRMYETRVIMPSASTAWHWSQVSMTSWSVTGMPVPFASSPDCWADAAGEKARERSNADSAGATGGERGCVRPEARFPPLPVLPLPGLIAAASLPPKGDARDARALMPVGDLNDRKQAGMAQSSARRQALPNPDRDSGRCTDTRALGATGRPGSRAGHRAIRPGPRTRRRRE